MASDNYSSFLVWAPGEPPLVLPDNLGGPLFGDFAIVALEIEIHYNNPGKFCMWRMISFREMVLMCI